MHGFDEFFGNLYHLNAEEEPEYADYPKDPSFRKKFGPRGVLKCKATDKDDTTVDPAVRQGRQADDREHRPADHASGWRRSTRSSSARRSTSWSARPRRARPWFCYFNPTRMHVFTHLKPSSVGKTGLGLYPDGMVELDGYVGQLLEKLDDLGVADNTIVVFTTDNGAEVLSWPDGGATPFRGEKDTNWEGGWRVPCVMRWPGVIEPGRVINDICSLQDFIPTFAAANGEPDLVEKVKKGYKIGDKTFKVHLDGFNLLPFLSGKEKESPREGFIYWSDDGDLMALRIGPVQDRVRRAAQQRASTSGASRCRRCASPRFSTCAPIRSSAARRASSTTTGSSSTCPMQYAAQAIVHEVAGELQGVPAARQGGELHHRPGRREADAEGRLTDGGDRLRPLSNAKQKALDGQSIEQRTATEASPTSSSSGATISVNRT